MPSLTRCVCTINPFIRLTHGNHNLVTQAVGFVQDGTVGRTYESPPTFRFTLWFAQHVQVLHEVTPIDLLFNQRLYSAPTGGLGSHLHISS